MFDTNKPSALPLLTGSYWTPRGTPKCIRTHHPVKIDQLPDHLNGIKIAHLSDTHIGRWTSEEHLKQALQHVQAIQPDLVCFTGDLINTRLKQLQRGIRFLEQVTEAADCEKSDLHIIEGNHDLFIGRQRFTQTLAEAGFSLLQNQSKTQIIRGNPIEIIGLAWPGSTPFVTQPIAQAFQELQELQQLQELKKSQRDEAPPFRLLLTHHPNAFKYAAQHNIHLTLAGHTHGGQWMRSTYPNHPTDTQPRKLKLRLKQRWPGPAQLIYPYCRGHYTREQSQLIVSGGIGNWFPLRLNAPAEVIEITLNRSTEPQSE